jgi:rubrerythrin
MTYCDVCGYTGDYEDVCPVCGATGEHLHEVE